MQWLDVRWQRAWLTAWIDHQAGKAGTGRRKDGKKEPAKENPVNAGDIADKIGKYKKLLDEGVLTQEEFDEVKAMLLKEI